MGLKLEDISVVKKAKGLPSPSEYNPNFNIFSKTQRVFSIGRAKRESLERKI
jgi:hypothetical protein